MHDHARNAHRERWQRSWRDDPAGYSEEERFQSAVEILADEWLTYLDACPSFPPELEEAIYDMAENWLDDKGERW